MPGTQKCLNYSLVNKFVSAKRALTRLTKVTRGQMGHPTESAGNSPEISSHRSCFQLYQRFALAQPLPAEKRVKHSLCFFRLTAEGSSFFPAFLMAMLVKGCNILWTHGAPFDVLGFSKAHLEARGKATGLKGKSQEIATIPADVVAEWVSFRWILRENRPCPFFKI